MTDEVDFTLDHLADAVEELPPGAIDALPFGAIRLSSDGRITFYSEAERRLSGYRSVPIGRDFFAEVAPCMNNPAFRGRVERVMAALRGEAAFSHIGDFNDPTKTLHVRVQRAVGGGCWIFMQREP